MAMNPSPTKPTLIIKRFDKSASRANVLHAPAPGLPLDRQSALELNRRERLEEGGPIHFSRPNDDLLPPSSGCSSPPGVFDMALLQPRPKFAQSRDGVSLVIHDHIGRVKIHAHFRAIQPAQKQFQGGGGLLPGFKTQGNPPRGKEFGNLADAVEQPLERRVV